MTHQISTGFCIRDHYPMPWQRCGSKGLGVFNERVNHPIPRHDLGIGAEDCILSTYLFVGLNWGKHVL